MIAPASWCSGLQGAWTCPLRAESECSRNAADAPDETDRSTTAPVDVRMDTSADRSGTERAPRPSGRRTRRTSASRFWKAASVSGNRRAPGTIGPVTSQRAHQSSVSVRLPV